MDYSLFHIHSAENNTLLKYFIYVYDGIRNNLLDNQNYLKHAIQHFSGFLVYKRILLHSTHKTTTYIKVLINNFINVK